MTIPNLPEGEQTIGWSGHVPQIQVALVTEQLSQPDMHDLCDTTDAAIENGGGFGWLDLPARDILERYWQGVITMPDRLLYIVRLDGVIAGSAQLIRPRRHNEAQAHAAHIMTAFIAPWARGHGLATQLFRAMIAQARREGYKRLNLDVRDTQTAAIALYERLGFVRWGTNPHYALVRGQYVPGHYYSLDLTNKKHMAALEQGEDTSKSKS